MCAVHRNGGEGDNRGKVLCWSPPLSDLQSVGGATISFDLGGFAIDGDVRVSVFDLDDLLDERRKRLKKGSPARLPFDGVPDGPWADTAESDAAAASKKASAP